MNGDQGGHLQFWLLVLLRFVRPSVSIPDVVNFFLQLDRFGSWLYLDHFP
jgi:hypothetical protein